MYRNIHEFLFNSASDFVYVITGNEMIKLLQSQSYL